MEHIKTGSHLQERAYILGVEVNYYSAVFWGLAPCTPVNSYQHYGGIYYLHI
jgi:hypothetical protein